MVMAMGMEIMLSSSSSTRLGRFSLPPSPRPRPRVGVRCSSVAQQRETGRVRDMLQLQNGSDIRGVAMEGEEGRAVNLTPQAVYYLGAAFGEWVASTLQDPTTPLRVSLGRDPRLSGPSLLAAAAAGLHSVGCAVFDMGLATTPACFMSTVLPPFSFHASIMLTASHLPKARNGLKFFTPRGGLDAEHVRAICLGAGKRAPAVFPFPAPPLQPVAVMPAYAGHLRELVKRGVNHPEHYETPLVGLKVVVNAGNGSGGFFATEVLEKLGADVSWSKNLEPDGSFPNHAPNPEDPKAMAVTVEAVLSGSTHLGVVFDTDVDRSGVVEENGGVINGDRLIALLSAIVLEEHPGSTVVTDARTCVGLEEFIRRRGGRHCLYRVGYRNVIGKGVRLNEAGVETELMMETSGHGAFRENFFLDDGAYAATKVLVHLVRLRLRNLGGLRDIISDLEEAGESVELRIPLLGTGHWERGEVVVEAFRTFLLHRAPQGWGLGRCGEDVCGVEDGCLADAGDAVPTDARMYRADIRGTGWIHLRQSLHNPNLALNLQSSSASSPPDTCRAMAHTLLHSFFLHPSLSHLSPHLDLSQLHTFLQH